MSSLPGLSLFPGVNTFPGFKHVMKVSATDDVITAVVANLSANVSYNVFDGPITKLPGRAQEMFIVVGSEDPQNDEAGSPVRSADMNQTWKGLGQVARDEELHIPCCAVGKSSTVTKARKLALSVTQDVFNYMGLHPTTETYNALVSDVSAIDSRNTAGGAVVTVKFTISAKARLT